MNKTAYGITPENMLRSLPAVLQNDNKMFALATSIADILSLRSAEIDRLVIYARIGSLPEDILDILALDFKVDWWDANYTLEEKRKTLRDSWSVHRTLGTKGAVEKALAAIYADTRVSEWFEYGGRPYCFKLLIDTSYEDVDPVKHRRVLDRLAFYKNLRSHLDGIEYIALQTDMPTTVGIVVSMHKQYMINLQWPVKRVQSIDLPQKCGLPMQTHMTYNIEVK